MKDRLSITDPRQEMEQPLDPEYDKAVRYIPVTSRHMDENHSFEEFCRRQRLRLNDKWERSVQRVRDNQPEQDEFESRK